MKNFAYVDSISEFIHFLIDIGVERDIIILMEQLIGVEF